MLPFFVSAASAAPGDTVWTLVGTGARADTGDGGHSRDAAINHPRAVSATPDGGFTWAEPWAHRVRIVDANGVVSTLAGTGEAGFSGDGGKATAAKVNFVHTAAPTADGGFLLADTLNNRIRKVSASGIITTVAGNGEASFAGDGGPATKASINSPRSVAPLADGGFLIPDSNSHRVRRVSAAGLITTVAGIGTPGFAGDGGPATQAQIATPFAVAPTADGGFLIVDAGNQRIRKVAPDGTITTVAGNGVAGFGGDNRPATATSLWNPHNVVELPGGAFLIADSSNERIRRVDTDGTITTVLGDGVRGYSGDGGPATAARIGAPKAIAVTPAGDLLVADEQNNRIRFVGTIVAPSNASAPTLSGNLLVGQQVSVSSGRWRGTGPVLSYQWQRCRTACVDVAGATSRTYGVTGADAGALVRAVVTATNPAGTARAVAVVSAPSTPGAPSPGSSGGSSGGSPPAGGGGGAGPPSGVPSPRPADWRVQVGKSYQRAGEYTIRAGNRRLADAVAAYGAATCTLRSPGRAVATWGTRGIRIELVVSKRGCDSPAASRVSEIRLADRRWTTALGLRVGDTVTALRQWYPRAPYLRERAGRGQFYLAWRTTRCSSCTGRGTRRVDEPRLVAHVAGGKVVALTIPVTS